MKTLVVYYSRTGNTKEVAIKKAKEIGADLHEIKTPVKTKGFIGYMRCAFQSLRQKKIPINVPPNLSDYDRVVICTPVWASKMSAPVYSFLKEYGKDIKTAEYVILHADKHNRYENVMDDMDKILEKKRIAGESIAK